MPESTASLAIRPPGRVQRLPGPQSTAESPLSSRRRVRAQDSELRRCLGQRRQQIGKAKSKSEPKGGADGKAKDKGKGHPKDKTLKGGKADPKA